MDCIKAVTPSSAINSLTIHNKIAKFTFLLKPMMQSTASPFPCKEEPQIKEEIIDVKSTSTSSVDVDGGEVVTGNTLHNQRIASISTTQAASPFRARAVFSRHNSANTLPFTRFTPVTSVTLACSKYIISCSLSLDLMLKYTGVKIELIRDISIFDYVNDSILGGICIASQNIADDKNGIISSCDIASLFPYIMAQKLPIGSHRFIKYFNRNRY